LNTLASLAHAGGAALFSKEDHMPTKTEMHALYDACEEMYAEQEDDERTMYAVISDIDGLVYGPYHSLTTALMDAERRDGLVFKLVRVEEGER
jgi:hypothetical protein